LTSVTEVLQANANGYRIHQRGGGGAPTIGHGFSKDGSGTAGASLGDLDNADNKAAIKAFFADGKRKFWGFDIVNSEQTCDVRNAAGHIEGTNVTFPTDAFRIIEGRAAVTSVHNTMNNVKNFRAGKFKDDPYKTETDPKKLRGFRPGDLDNTGNATANGHNL